MQIHEVRISRDALQDMARHLVSHNRRWDYVFHIEDGFVIVGRIIPAKMNKG